MCGIAAYIGKDDAFDFISKALVKMEYRGYDSYGLRIGHITKLKHLGNFVEYKFLGAPSDSMPEFIEGNAGIGHTRWATHGEVSLDNCHPIEYMGCYVVHNGIVENEQSHRDRQRGHYATDTDTEIIACEIFRNLDLSIDKLDGVGSFVAMINGVRGLLVCRGSNPLYYQDGKIASDLRAFEGEVYVIPENTKIQIDEDFKAPEDWKTVEADKEAEEHIECHMKHEIESQSEIIKNLELTNIKLPQTRVKLVACGSSYYAAIMAAHFMNKQGNKDATAVYATEFMFTGHEDAVVFISQSGETKDVIDALKLLNSSSKSWQSSLHSDGPKHTPIFILQNKKESTLSQVCPSARVINISSGLEVGVAATKTFSTTVCQLLKMGGVKVDTKEISEELQAGNQVPVTSYLQLAHFLSSYKHILVLGSDNFYPLALEAALKFKEVAYIHAEAMPADEIKHGPIALIDKETISIVIGDQTSGKIENNIKQIEARGGSVVRMDDSWWSTLCKLQWTSYNLAILRGLNPDKPRNLAKTVTV